MFNFFSPDNSHAQPASLTQIDEYFRSASRGLLHQETMQFPLERDCFEMRKFIVLLTYWCVSYHLLISLHLSQYLTRSDSFFLYFPPGQSVGGAFSSAKTAMSSWLSTFTTSTPQSLPEPPDGKP